MMPQGQATSTWCHVNVMPLRIQIVQSQRVDALQAPLVQPAAQCLMSGKITASQGCRNSGPPAQFSAAVVTSEDAARMRL